VRLQVAFNWALDAEHDLNRPMSELEQALVTVVRGLDRGPEAIPPSRTKILHSVRA
jgi:hypothetical protein